MENNLLYHQWFLSLKKCYIITCYVHLQAGGNRETVPTIKAFGYFVPLFHACHTQMLITCFCQTNRFLYLFFKARIWQYSCKFGFWKQIQVKWAPKVSKILSYFFQIYILEVLFNHSGGFILSVSHILLVANFIQKLVNGTIFLYFSLQVHLAPTFMYNRNLSKSLWNIWIDCHTEFT